MNENLNDMENTDTMELVETTRTIKIPQTTFKEVTIALPYYGKEDKGYCKQFHKLTATYLYTVAFYSTQEPSLYNRRSATCMDAEDSNVSTWDVSTPEEFYQALAEYRKVVENI